MVCVYVGYKFEVFWVCPKATDCSYVVCAVKLAKWLKFVEIGVLERSPSLVWGLCVVAQWVV